jgi:hypothetical protein
LILGAVLLSTGIWLWDLYHRPSGLMIRSFLQGYFLGSFVMAWINVRSGRVLEEEPTLRPGPPPA